MTRLQNPPRGTTWQGREVLKQAVITADVRLAGFLFKFVWRVADDHSYPPGGRPPRLTELPPEWFPAEFNAQLATIRSGAADQPDDTFPDGTLDRIVTPPERTLNPLGIPP